MLEFALTVSQLDAQRLDFMGHGHEVLGLLSLAGEQGAVVDL